MRVLTLALIAVVIFDGHASLAQSAGNAASPHVLVYKAKAKYKNLVPVQLSPDKKTIVSYPAPTDVNAASSGFPYPGALHGGYWLDRIGVGPNTAYLNLTFKEYSKLTRLPSADELYMLIVDKAPITEICDCGIRSSKNSSVSYLNGLIDKKQLKKKCKQVK
jgi:hypothetical protein